MLLKRTGACHQGHFAKNLRSARDFVVYLEERQSLHMFKLRGLVGVEAFEPAGLIAISGVYCGRRFWDNWFTRATFSYVFEGEEWDACFPLGRCPDPDGRQPQRGRERVRERSCVLAGCGCGSKPMQSHFGVGEFTTRLRTYFSWDWVPFTGGTGF